MPSPRETAPEVWRPAREVVRRLTSPIQRFLAIESASGLVLVIATAVALVLANSPARDAYHALWETPLGVGLGEWSFVRPLHFWVNDGLMTIFFFVVGIEIRREMHEGELSDLRRAALPLVAAVGGMLVPAAIYTAINHGHPGARGWGVPMATDIAFAIGAITVLGSRVPGALRVLLLALAVIDDIGAIVVIAVFYSGGVELDGLGLAALGVVAILAVRATGARAVWFYLGPGFVVWLGLYRAGVHPTLAGVIVGLCTPPRAWYGPDGFREVAAARLDQMATHPHAILDDLAAIRQAALEAVSPIAYLQHALHALVAFGIMPLFALANAGVSVGGADLAADGRIFLGVAIGLVVGKPIGIHLASWLTARAGLTLWPRGVGHAGLLVVGAAGGIGFTMSLFVAQLAFPPGPMLAAAKLGILAGSITATVVGLGLGRALLRPPAVGDPPLADEALAESSDDA